MIRQVVIFLWLVVLCSCASAREVQMPAMQPSSDAGRSVGHKLDFRQFIWRFFTDPSFQVDHVAFPLLKEWKNTDRDFKIMSETIEKRDWKHLPGPEHYRCIQNCYDIVIYDNFDSEFRGTTERVLAFEGIDNGINSALYFKLVNGEWMLVKWADLND